MQGKPVPCVSRATVLPKKPLSWVVASTVESAKSVSLMCMSHRGDPRMERELPHVIPLHSGSPGKKKEDNGRCDARTLSRSSTEERTGTFATENLVPKETRAGDVEGRTTAVRSQRHVGMKPSTVLQGDLVQGAAKPAARQGSMSTEHVNGRLLSGRSPVMPTAASLSLCDRISR